MKKINNSITRIAAASLVLILLSFFGRSNKANATEIQTNKSQAVLIK